MRILGAILLVFGFFISLSIVGAIFGIPMMIVGAILLLVGGRRKTVINNVVTVNSPAPQATPDNWPTPTRNDHFVDRPREPKLIDATPVKDVTRPQPMRSSKGYDEEKWAALVRFDDDISRVVAALEPYGQKYVDELAKAYLTLNDKQYLPMIIQKIIASARGDAAASGAAAVQPTRRQTGGA